jgi:calcineurin-like phosphoesterase family protein
MLSLLHRTMSNIWVISDTHFRHSNILNFIDHNTGKLVRPMFTDVDAMDEHIIERWNSVVKTGDTVYHLGDVVMGKDKLDWMNNNWSRLNGSKRLIVGNHDDIKFLVGGGFFQKVSMWRMFPEFGLMFSHVPLHINSLYRYPSKDSTEKFEPEIMLNVHGHLHQNPSPEGPYRNVCVETVNYTPINIEELRIK